MEKQRADLTRELDDLTDRLEEAGGVSASQVHTNANRHTYHTHTYTHTDTHTCTHMPINPQTHVYTQRHTDTNQQTHTQSHTHTHLYTHVHTHTQTHTKRRTHKHGHTQTSLHVTPPPTPYPTVGGEQETRGGAPALEAGPGGVVRPIGELGGDPEEAPCRRAGGAGGAV